MPGSVGTSTSGELAQPHHPPEEDPVTAAANHHLPAPGDWTTDDLDRLPEDGKRRELIDGVLIVSPSPTTNHQVIVNRLMTALDVVCPAHLYVTQGVEIRINLRRSLTPDVLVVRAEAVRGNPSHFPPDQVLLAVEIVSPGSKKMDRVRKPSLYAEARIPCFWRIETDPGIVVHVHRLAPDGAVYKQLGSFPDVVQIDEPWEIELPIAAITPREP
jgi:Uma2 family endonuclease